MTVPLKRKGNTSIRQEDGDTVVRYHQTDIVRFNAERVILNHGGWRTLSTKDRMNQTAREFGLGFSVYQKNRMWYVELSDDFLFDPADGNRTIEWGAGLLILVCR